MGRYTRKVQLDTNIQGIQETLGAISRPMPSATMTWVQTGSRWEFKMELEECGEVRDGGVDACMARTQSTQARSARAVSMVRMWHKQICEKITSIRRATWMAAASYVRPSHTSSFGSSHCHPVGVREGFLEKVRLPQFSGVQDKYGEFKSQFQEMCRGRELFRHYQNLPSSDRSCQEKQLPYPRGAYDSLLQPGPVSMRGMATYDMSVISALKRLKSFRPARAPPHDQVVEIATAVQRCVTILTTFRTSAITATGQINHGRSS